jgi:outer membrane protein
LLSGQAAAETKVGYLNVSRVTEESPQYQAARKALQRDLDRREKDLRAKAGKLKKLENKLQRNGATMSASELKKLERDILSRQRKLKNARDEARDELALRQNEERNKLMRQVAEVVKAIGKEKGFDLILTDGVAYSSKKVDISDQVLSRLKKGFKKR